MSGFDWKSIFLCGTEWDCLQDVFRVDWDFTHLEKELTTGKWANLKDDQLLYLFGGTEPQMVEVAGQGRVVPIPFICVVDSTYPIPEKLGLNSVQMEKEAIVPMARFKMGWHELEITKPASGAGAGAGGERSKKRTRTATKMFALKCSQRKTALGQLGEERLHRFDYCMPYIMFPKKVLNAEVDTAVEVIVEIPGRTTPLVFEYDWSMDDLSDMVEEKMEEDNLPKGFEDTLRESIRTQVNAAKQARRDEKAAKQKMLDEMDPKERESLDNLTTHKFYPCQKDPDVSGFRSRFINRYYGQASQVD